MTRRRPRQGQRGAPSLLTDEREKALVEATKMGVPAEVAAQAAGIGARTFMLWLARGREEEDNRAAADYTPNPVEEPYLELWLKILEARAQAATRNVLLIQKVAQGGIVTEETTRKYRDPDSGEMVTETTVKRSLPDWRASAFMLEKQHRRHFGKEAVQVELTGADGGPVQVGQVDAEDLANRLTANIKALAAGAAAASAAPQRAIEPARDSEPVDAEIVEDSEG